MKSGPSSSLNPYAASYIPLSRRAAADENKNSLLTAKDSDIVHDSLWEEQFKNMTLNQSKVSQNYMSHNTLSPRLKTNTGHESYGSSSQIPKKMTDKQIMDDEFEMDLAYLQMTFPGISEESLYEIYLVNKGDVEAAIDMLNQLESCSGYSSENLPDTLDIGDVSESGSSGESASLKLKNRVSGEASGTSSGSTKSRVATLLNSPK